MRAHRASCVALAMAGLTIGCCSKPCQKPRILSSYAPAGAPLAPPINSQARPIAVPTAPVAQPVPVVPVVPAAPAFAVPGVPPPGAPAGYGPPPAAQPAPLPTQQPVQAPPQQQPPQNGGYSNGNYGQTPNYNAPRQDSNPPNDRRRYDYDDDPRRLVPPAPPST